MQYIYIHAQVHSNTLNTPSYDKSYFGEDGLMDIDE